jgi:hypothetical protein
VQCFGRCLPESSGFQKEPPLPLLCLSLTAISRGARRLAWVSHYQSHRQKYEQSGIGGAAPARLGLLPCVWKTRDYHPISCRNSAETHDGRPICGLLHNSDCGQVGYIGHFGTVALTRRTDTQRARAGVALSRGQPGGV